MGQICQSIEREELKSSLFSISRDFFYENVAAYETIILGRLQNKQVERLKSHDRRAKVDRLGGQWAQWLIDLMIDRLNGP